MGIPGEDLQGSHPATEFVAWYNGHPDYRDLQFDLSQERVAVVGVGNVAVDVARILCRSAEELAKTDIADYALEALRKSRVREVYLLGRRGPAQAAFTNPEIKELGELADADVSVVPDEVELDPLSRAALETSPDRATVQEGRDPPGLRAAQAERQAEAPDHPLPRLARGADRQCATARSAAIRLVRNRLVAAGPGHPPAQADGRQFEELPVGLVFRSVGYRGRAAARRALRRELGRHPERQGARARPRDASSRSSGEYTAGWIKRGPTGVIGTNKPDAAETVECMMEDLAAGRTSIPPSRMPRRAERLIRRAPAQALLVRRLAQAQRARGRARAPTGRPRVKFTRVDEMDEPSGDPDLPRLSTRSCPYRVTTPTRSRSRASPCARATMNRRRKGNSVSPSGRRG